MSELRIGGKPPLMLQACDELQCRTALGTWLPVEVVVAEKPEHPDVVEARERSAAIRESILENIGPGGDGVPKGWGRTADGKLIPPLGWVADAHGAAPNLLPPD